MVPNTQSEIIDLTIGPNCDVHDVDNAKVVGLDHVAYSATHLSWRPMRFRRWRQRPERRCPRCPAMSRESTCTGAGTGACRAQECRVPVGARAQYGRIE